MLATMTMMFCIQRPTIVDVDFVDNNLLYGIYDLLEDLIQQYYIFLSPSHLSVKVFTNPPSVRLHGIQRVIRYHRYRRTL